MDRLGFLIPGDPNQKTGGYLYNRRILEFWKEQNWPVDLITIPHTSEDIKEEDSRNLNEILTDPRWSHYLIDGLAGAWMEKELSQAKKTKNIIYLEHLPLKEHWETEKDAIEKCSQVIVTSKYAHETLKRKGIDLPIYTIQPGSSIKEVNKKKVYSNTVKNILFIGSLTPRKDPMTLLRVLKQFQQLDWQLHICTSSTNNQHALKVLSWIKEEQLSERVKIHIAIEQEDLYSIMTVADVMVVTSREETFGMAVAEGIEIGLPIIANRIKAFESHFSDYVHFYSGIEKLSLLLEEIITSPENYNLLVKQALENNFEMPSWEDSATKLWSIIMSK